MEIIYFSSQQEFRGWLEVNHESSKEIIVGFYKVKTGKPSMTWSESVDVALCFGWIDGIRKSVDNDSYSIRFTPRNPKSTWSNININKVEALIKAGLMTEAGMKAYQLKNNEKSGIYSFENDLRQLPDEFLLIIKGNSRANAYYEKLAPSHKKAYIHWILSAKQEATRFARLMKLITAMEENRRLM